MPESGAFGEDGRPRRLGAFDLWNFRAYFVGQFLSTVGTWMQTFALGQLVLDLTGRSDRLGVAVALQFLPLLLFGAHAGLLADRVNNRKLLLATSTLGGLLAAGMWLITSSGNTTIWWIYVFSGAFGLVSAMERPVMQSILFELVGPDRLPSAIGINGTINTAGRLVGPALAGFMIGWFGYAACFGVNALSYFVVVTALFALRASEFVSRPLRARGAGGLREGFRYVRTQPDVLRPLVVMAVIGTLAYNFQTTIPAMVRFGFDGGPKATAGVMSISAIGSIAGGMVVAGLRLHNRRALIWSTAGLGVGLLLFASAPSYAWFVIFCLPLGFVSSAFLTVDAAVLQQATAPEMQGRVMSLHQIAWFGSTPIGALLMGWLIEASSPRVPFYVASASAFVCASVVLTRARQRTGAGAVDHGVASSS